MSSPSNIKDHGVCKDLRLAIVCSDISHYHQARFRAAASRCTLDVVEIGAVPGFSEFGWKGEVEEYNRHSLFESMKYFDILQQKGVRFEELRDVLFKKLHELSPDTLVIKGYAFIDSYIALNWAARNRCPVILLSESQASDFQRSARTEMPKRLLLRQISASLVGGTPHQDYMESLGMESRRIFKGYDVVDNDHFKQGAAAARDGEKEKREALELPPRYILASGRMIPKKNFKCLLHAYLRYFQKIKADENKKGEILHLVFLGDGEERKNLQKIAEEADMLSYIHFAGYQPFEKLPIYYALADAFVLPSYREQWGLVVNEAMASGCPVIVSDAAGCAHDLLKPGINGWKFPPHDEQELARHLLEVHQSTWERLREMGTNGQEIIAQWGPERFASGLIDAARCAIASPRPPRPPGQRLLLWALQQRAKRVFIEDHA